ncbi:MAG: T9SS type A sorting domain-containing protein, partial [Chitinophagales bacterium]
RNALIPTNQFSTDLPLNELSFVTSTQSEMTSDLILGQTKSPIKFPYQIVTNKTLGYQNSVAFVEVNNMVTSKGGGTFYFHYQRKAGSGIQSAENANFDIYPIPSNGRLTISARQTQKEDMKVRVLDLLGKEVKFITISKFETIKDIDCTQLPSGNYILNLDNGAEQFNKKITIER